MSEFLNPEVETEQKPPFQETLHQIYQIMQENNVYGVRVWTNNQLFDLAHSDPQVEKELEDKLLESLQKDRNGFLVFEGANPDKKTVIFKMKLENSQDDRGTGHNEEYFYEDIVPEIKANWPADLTRVKLPELYESGQATEGSYVVTEFAEGEQVGNVRETDHPLTDEEFDELVKFIRFFHNLLPPDKVKSISPRMDFDLPGDAPTFDFYERKFNSHRPMLNKMLGEDYVAKMDQMLSENADLMKNSPLCFVNQDIVPANLVRSEDKLTIIDWERLKISPNPAAPYSHLIESHWQWPEIQNQMIQKTLEANKDIPHFKDFLRLDMIFFKYSIGYWWSREKPDNLPQKQELYDSGSQALVNFLKDAIDKKGVWEDKEETGNE